MKIIAVPFGKSFPDKKTFFAVFTENLLDIQNKYCDILAVQSHISGTV